MCLLFWAEVFFYRPLINLLIIQVQEWWTMLLISAQSKTFPRFICMCKQITKRPSTSTRNLDLKSQRQSKTIIQTLPHQIVMFSRNSLLNPKQRNSISSVLAFNSVVKASQYIELNYGAFILGSLYLSFEVMFMLFTSVMELTDTKYKFLVFPVVLLPIFHVFFGCLWWSELHFPFFSCLL